MLRIRTAVEGAFLRISRVACTPSRPGMDMSITTTRGANFSAMWMASTPVPASPMTWISGSSSRILRKPLRTSWWSSTNSTVISFNGLPPDRVAYALVRAASRLVSTPGSGRCRESLDTARTSAYATPSYGSHLRQRYLQNHQRSALRRAAPLQRSLQNVGALAHGDQTQSAIRGNRHADTMVLHLQPQMISCHHQPDPGIGGLGMPHHVVQRLLQNAI